MSEHVRVAIIGSGFSGLGVAIALTQSGREDFVVLERAESVGGTWRDNDYPGCRCDIPSHVYSFSFELNPFWTRGFAPQPEIRQYLERTTDKYGIRPPVRFGHEVSRRAGTWTPAIERFTRVTAISLRSSWSAPLGR